MVQSFLELTLEYYNFGLATEEVGVMRVLLDHELLTLREAQRLLNVNRCTIDEMITTGNLTTIKIGSQLKVEGISIKKLLSPTELKNCSFPDVEADSFFYNASSNELTMIADWT